MTGGVFLLIPAKLKTTLYLLDQNQESVIFIGLLQKTNDQLTTSLRMRTSNFQNFQNSQICQIQ